MRAMNPVAKQQNLAARALLLGPWLWAALIGALMFRWFGSHGYDDPFITYRYAENIAAGAGFVYNAGERVLSTTTPLYALILAVARMLGADVPTLSNALGAVCLALGGLAFWELGRAWRTPAAGLVGMIAFPLFPLLATTLGSEVALYLALTLGGFLAYARERYLPVALLLGLAALVRADGVLAAALLAGAFLWQRRRPIPWRAIALYCALLLPWLFFAQLYFGAPFPVTLAAKRRQGLMRGAELFLPGLLAQARDNYWRFPVFRPMFALAAAGLPFGLWARSPWLLLAGWSTLYALAYAALGVTSYFWYYGPVIVGFVALVGLGAEAAARLVQRGWQNRAMAGAMAAVLAFLVANPERGGLLYLRDHGDTRQAIYRATGEWLRANTPPGASVGTLEVGMIGYYAQRSMVDFAGLLQPAIAQQLGPASSYDDAALWAFAHYQPDYLVLQDGALPRLQAQATADTRCEVVHTLRDDLYAFPILILACPQQ
jgi:hypothetical protein